MLENKMKMQIGGRVCFFLFVCFFFLAVECFIKVKKEKEKKKGKHKIEFYTSNKI